LSELFPPDILHPYYDEPLTLEDLRYSGDPDPDAPDAPTPAWIEPMDYPPTDYLCLNCTVEPDCNPHSRDCPRRAHLRRRNRKRHKLRRLLRAVRRLQETGAHVTGGTVAAILNRTRSGIHPRIRDALARGLIARDSPRGRLYLTPAGERYLDRSGG
jgi:hypothetical protein